MSHTRVGAVALIDLRDEVADLRKEVTAQGKRLTQTENAFTELGRSQRIIVGKLEEVLQALRDAFPKTRK